MQMDFITWHLSIFVTYMHASLSSYICQSCLTSVFFLAFYFAKVSFTLLSAQLLLQKYKKNENMSTSYQLLLYMNTFPYSNISYFNTDRIT